MHASADADVIPNVVGSRRKPRRTAEARLDVRTSPQIKDAIERAAALSGRSVTEFVVASAKAAADEALRSEFVLQLTLEQSDRLVAALMAPAKPNASLLQAAARRRDLLGE
jgi:uncharacterized protein (DUF1778 family)